MILSSESQAFRTVLRDFPIEDGNDYSERTIIGKVIDVNRNTALRGCVLKSAPR